MKAKKEQKCEKLPPTSKRSPMYHCHNSQWLMRRSKEKAQPHKPLMKVCYAS